MLLRPNWDPDRDQSDPGRGFETGGSWTFAGSSLPVRTTAWATLSFWYWLATDGSLSYAWQEVDILDSSGQMLQQVFHQLTNDRSWIGVTVDLLKYAGPIISIQFLDQENANGLFYYAYIYVDDVTLIVQ